MNPTLVILAAGMGSRYGGLKQLDGFGPSGETIMDYSLHDALRAGFAKVVFVIRRDFESGFREAVGRRYEGRVAVEYVFQELGDLPAGFTAPAARAKPWGTAHAIWCARRAVAEPFASINADDYYGKRSFGAVAEHLMRGGPDYCMVGYPILQTLSEHAPVARAICKIDHDGYVEALVERTDVERSRVAGDEVVSMNFWGFRPPVFEQLERHIARFLEADSRVAERAECLIPAVVNQLVQERAARVRVLPTSDTWFGVTHPQDKLGVMNAIRAMVERGEYPSQ
jgi:NDP-sugar pyrophosphorylase family protein